MPEAEPNQNPRAKNLEFEERIKAIEKFCKDLIESLQQAEHVSGNKLILLPEGVYFGKSIV